MSDETMTPAAEPASDAATPAVQPEAKTTEPAEPKNQRGSIRDSLQRSMDAVEREHPRSDLDEARDILTGRTSEPPKSEPPVRGPDGKFSPREPAKAEAEKPAEPAKDAKPAEAKREAEAEAKPAAPVSDAPARFSPEAKAEWEKAPEKVRQEITRAITEMEGGIAKHKERAAHLDGLDELIEQAPKIGKTPNQMLKEYVAIDKAFSNDFLGGLDMLCKSAGVSIHDVASAVLGKDANQHVSQAERAIAERDQEIAKLTRELTTFREERQRTEAETLSSEITTFFRDNPGAEPMRAHMGRVIQQGLAADLPEAFRLASRLYGDGAPQPQAPASPARQPDIAAQTRKGQASISGAPGVGSNPGSTRPPSSARDALKQAFSSVGIPH